MDQDLIDGREMLLIGSDCEWQTMIARELGEMGPLGKVVIVRDCESAITRLREPGRNRPRLALLDLDMPQRSAFSFLEKVKADPVLRVIPIVVLAGGNDHEDVAACYSLGAAGYLVKSDVTSSLAEKIRSVCGYWALSRVPTM